MSSSCEKDPLLKQTIPAFSPHDALAVPMLTDMALGVTLEL